MSIVVVGLNHRTAPISLLERMTVPVASLPKALADLKARDHIAEVAVLSTCNRTEVYAVCETFHGALADLHGFFAGLTGISEHHFADHLVTFYDDAAAAHLFRVAAGLESAVVGETEILGQVRVAWERAAAEKAAGAMLSALFRHALEVGKRSRSETAIARGTASVSQAAVELAAARLGSLVGKRVLVLGAGEIGVSMAQALHRAGADSILVANRSRARATQAAARIGGTAVALHELPQALEGVDLLLSATSAAEIVLDRCDIEAVMAARAGRPLLIVDAALPRDIDPSSSGVPGVTLLDLDAIRRFVESGLEERRREIDRVQAIVEEELLRWQALSSARQVAPVVAALRARFEEIRAAELGRAGARLGDGDLAALDALTRQLLAKLLHEPTVRLKDAAGTPRGQRMADALRTLFDL